MLRGGAGAFASREQAEGGRGAAGLVAHRAKAVRCSSTSAAIFLAGSRPLSCRRCVAREVIQPAGTQELFDQLEMANVVRAELCNDIAMRTDELAILKVEHAQLQEEREDTAQRLRRSEQKSRLLALRMTKLEVKLADAQSTHAADDEEKALVFKEAMEAMEATSSKRICGLEAQLAEAKRAPPQAKPKWPFS